MAHFTPVYEDEFRDLLLPEKGWRDGPWIGGERTFEFPVKSRPGVVIRVYTSLGHLGKCRGNGCDAIRVCAVDTRTNRGVVKATRVHRVLGWRKNLEKRVMSVWNQCKQQAIDFTR